MTSIYRKFGFTVVELLIVIVIISILAAISAVAYNGVRERSNDSRRANDIRSASKLLEIYYASNGQYPSTGGLGTVYADSNCKNANPNKRTDWIPGIADLPQFYGPQPRTGCYLYASDGKEYIMSAWKGLETGPQESVMYRRIGFRETAFSGDDRYHCSTNPANRDYWNNFYKYSYTISNITSCDESNN